MSAVTDDITTEALKAAGDLGEQLRITLSEAERLATENARLRDELEKVAEEPIAPTIILEKVALDQTTIDETLMQLEELELLTPETREKWARELKNDPNAGLKLAQRVASVTVNLPADPGGSPVEKAANANAQSLKRLRSGAAGSTWFD